MSARRGRAHEASGVVVVWSPCWVTKSRLRHKDRPARSVLCRRSMVIRFTLRTKCQKYLFFRGIILIMKYTCPISKTTVDEHIVRLIAFFVLILIPLGFFYSRWIFLFLTLDFLARIYKAELSPLKYLARLVIHGILKMKPKPIGAAPKRFAAGIGLFFSLAIFISIQGEVFCTRDCQEQDHYFRMVTETLVIIFMIATFLEIFFSYCLGCKTYSVIQ